MREIIFRGKRTGNDEWVYGDFMHGNERKSLRDSIWVYDSETQSFNDYEVTPETVGQYTGMKDNNGKPIFEGDILKLGTGKTRFVFYGVSSFRHTIYNGYAKGFDFKDKGYQVIGNIHDNPELLGENG